MRPEQKTNNLLLRDIQATSQFNTDPRYQQLVVHKVKDAVIQALETPDIEVRISFDSMTELVVSKEIVNRALFKHGTSVAHWVGNALEIVNGSAIVFKLK